VLRGCGLLLQSDGKSKGFRNGISAEISIVIKDQEDLLTVEPLMLSNSKKLSDA
jgi:hypothetical protein